MGKVIKITPQLEVVELECPEPLSYHFFQEQIGGMIERVRPKRLYSLLKKAGLPDNYCILVDEEGLLKNLDLNDIGCFLYETDKHGYPIVGPLLIVKETYEDFVAMNEEEYESILAIIKKLRDAFINTERVCKS